MGRGHAPERAAARAGKKNLEAAPELRALFALASHLRTTVSSLQQSLSAQEFVQWTLWMQAEQVGPEWDALRHAQLLAAVANGEGVKPDKRLFTAADFQTPDPWVPADKRPKFLNPEDAALGGMFEVAANE